MKLWCRERKYRGKYKEKTECRVVTERDTVNENQFVLFEIESERRSNWLKALYQRDRYSKNTALESLAIACTITRINIRALRQKIFSLSRWLRGYIYRAKLESRRKIFFIYIHREQRNSVLYNDDMNIINFAVFKLKKIDSIT